MKVASGKVTPPAKGFTQLTAVAAGPTGLGYIKITHMQGVKQSSNYQSGDVSYAVELYAKDNPKDIKLGIERAEQIVEDALGDKLPQMTQVLAGLAKINGK